MQWTNEHFCATSTWCATENLNWPIGSLLPVISRKIGLEVKVYVAAEWRYESTFGYMYQLGLLVSVKMENYGRALRNKT